MNKFLFGASAAAIFVTASVAAQPAAPVPPAPTPQVQIMRMQHQPMRVQTRNEVVQHVRDLFARLDTNRDGFITRDEADNGMQAMGGEMRERFAQRLAERGDKMPDRSAAFDRLDTNKDGMISRQEFMSARPQFEQRVMVMRNGAGGEPGGPGMMRMHGMGMGLHGRLFEMADANHDGKLSLQEVTNAALQHFDSADVNHDGQLTPDERMQMRQRIRIQRQPA
jgi:Ca2+-binding EF-hand superfamily protein